MDNVVDLKPIVIRNKYRIHNLENVISLLETYIQDLKKRIDAIECRLGDTNPLKMGGGDDYPSLDTLCEETLLASQFIEKIQQKINTDGDLKIYVKEKEYGIRIKGIKIEKNSMIIDV